MMYCGIVQLLAVGRRQAMRAQQRVELSRRASTEVIHLLCLLCPSLLSEHSGTLCLESQRLSTPGSMHGIATCARLNAGMLVLFNLYLAGVSHCRSLKPFDNLGCLGGSVFYQELKECDVHIFPGRCMHHA